MADDNVARPTNTSDKIMAERVRAQKALQDENAGKPVTPAAAAKALVERVKRQKAIVAANEKGEAPPEFD